MKVVYNDPCNKGRFVSANVLMIFSNGDVRTDRDGMRTRNEIIRLYL